MIPAILCTEFYKEEIAKEKAKGEMGFFRTEFEYEKEKLGV